MKALITNIQRFSLHDGPGIRTTIFFKGCGLKCPWCANPECINFDAEPYYKEGVKGIYGKKYTIDELYNEIIKDKEYYGQNGGVTLSGGECLFAMKEIEPLLKKLKSSNINICIETSLVAPKEYLEIATKYVDHFYVDIKVLDKEKAILINSNVDLFMNNLDYLYKKKTNIIIRIPMVPNYTYTDRNMEAIIKVLKKYKFSRIELFKIHSLAESKYKSLGKEITKFEKVKNNEIENIRNELSKYCNDVEIIKI